jgi:hypothetical protein
MILPTPKLPKDIGQVSQVVSKRSSPVHAVAEEEKQVVSVQIGIWDASDWELIIVI